MIREAALIPVTGSVFTPLNDADQMDERQPCGR